MTGRTSVKNFVDIGDAAAPIGSPSWCRASHVELCAVKRRTDHEVRLLKYGLLEFKQKERWRQLYDNNDQPFQSWEDYVQYPEPNGLGMPPESVKAVLEEMNDGALLGDVLGKQGRPKWIDQVSFGKGSNTTIFGTGRGAKYIASRLERADEKDLARSGLSHERFTELATKVRANEMPANAAAIEAGFRKRPIALEVILRLLPKLTPEELDQVSEKIALMRKSSSDG